MSAPFNPGDVVLYRCPKGWGTGRIVHAVEGKYTIATAAGKQLVRTAANVKALPVEPARSIQVESLKDPPPAA